jgi:hypothetical protein
MRHELFTSRDGVSGWLLALVACSFGQGTSSNAQLPVGTVALYTSDYRFARLAPNALTSAVAFQIDNASELQFTITFSGVSPTIQGPSGQLVTPANVGSFGGQYAALEGVPGEPAFVITPAGNPGFQFLYRLLSLGAGTYTVQLQADPAISQDQAVIVELIAQSPLAVALFFTEQVVTSGTNVVLTAAVFDGSTPVQGASVNVTIIPPLGPEYAIILNDNGIQADSAAADGLYSGFMNPLDVGPYDAFAQITGTIAGGAAFSRAAVASIRVVPSCAAFAGPAAIRAVNDNGNFYLEKLAVDVPVNVVTAGTFILHAALQTPSGRFLPAYGQGPMALGLQTMTATVSAEAICANGEDGPYSVETLELLCVGPDGATPSDRIGDAGISTEAYGLDVFERPMIRLTGVNQDYGIDYDSDGGFDVLAVDLGIEVLVGAGGVYQYSVALFDSCSDEIQFLSGTRSLPAFSTVFWLDFDGAVIGANDLSGPYVVQDFLLFGADYSLTAPIVLETQAYDAAEFDSFVSSGDCNQNGAHDRCDVSNGNSLDVNEDLIPDECEDCNGNRLIDTADIAGGTSCDRNVNQIPDECECGDVNVCTWDGFDAIGACVQAARPWGDVWPPGGDGNVDVSDILCAVDCFGEFCSCPGADIANCMPDRNCDVGDVLAVFDAFVGLDHCGCGGGSRKCGMAIAEC